MICNEKPNYLLLTSVGGVGFNDKSQPHYIARKTSVTLQTEKENKLL